MCFAQLLPVLNESEVLEPWNRAVRAKLMGKRKASDKAVSLKRFPIGELAKRRKELKEKYLAENATLQVVKKELEKVSKRVSL
jgi:hypothetical protein